MSKDNPYRDLFAAVDRVASKSADRRSVWIATAIIASLALVGEIAWVTVRLIEVTGK